MRRRIREGGNAPIALAEGVKAQQTIIIQMSARITVNLRLFLLTFSMRAATVYHPSTHPLEKREREKVAVIRTAAGE